LSRLALIDGKQPGPANPNGLLLLLGAGGLPVPHPGRIGPVDPPDGGFPPLTGGLVSEAWAIDARLTNLWHALGPEDAPPIYSRSTPHREPTAER